MKKHARQVESDSFSNKIQLIREAINKLKQKPQELFKNIGVNSNRILNKVN